MMRSREQGPGPSYSSIYPGTKSISTGLWTIRYQPVDDRDPSYFGSDTASYVQYYQGFSVPTPPVKSKLVENPPYSWTEYLVDTDKISDWFVDAVKPLDRALLDAWKGNDKAYALSSYDKTTMIDTTTADFKSRSAKGERIVNPAQTETLKFNAPPFRSDSESCRTTLSSYKEETGSYALKVQTEAKIPFSIGFDENIVSTLKGTLTSAFSDLTNPDSLYADAYSAKDDAEVELLVMLAEAQRTVDYLSDTLRKLNRILRQVRRGDFSFLGKKVSSFTPAQKWLEARYAIRPLVYDVENTYRYLFNKNVKKDILRTSRRDADSDQGEVSFPYTCFGITGEVTLSAVYDEVSTAGLYSQLSLDLARSHDLGLFNTTKAAWEKVPWSFVFDWFVNISGLLTSLNPNPIYRPLSGWTSTRRTYQFTGAFSASHEGININIPISGMYETYQRNKEGTPVPITLDFNLSTPKVLDLIGFGSRR